MSLAAIEAPPPYLRPFFAKVSANPLGEAFEGRRPLIPWIGAKPVPPESIAGVWRGITDTPRSGKAVAYVHVPFCANHCLFCNFYRNSTRRIDTLDYAQEVIRELEREAETAMVRSGPIHAVYFGGGTPTDLNADALARMVTAIREKLPLAGDCEITMEARATGFDQEKIEACLDAGVNRISVGVQSFDTAIRRRMGRRLSGEELAAFLKRLTAYDRATIVCDLIFGLPDQSRESFLRDIAICNDAGLDGVDLYCLTLLPESPLAKAIEKGVIRKGASIPEQAELYQAGVEALERHGWRHLTTAHFARDTRERNLYNQWLKAGATCLAYGSGAGGFAAGYSYMLMPDLDRYATVNAMGAKPLAGLFAASPGHAAKGCVTGGLEIGRLDLSEVEQAGASGLIGIAAPLLAQWQEAGLLEQGDSVIRLTLAGRFWHTNLASALHRIIDGLFTGSIP